MRSRTVNILTSVACLLAAIGCLMSMQAANATQPVIIAMWVAVVCTTIMLVRTVVAAIALRKFNADTDAGLMEFAIGCERDASVRDKILGWLSTYEGRTSFDGQARLANVADLVNEEGRKDGYWLLFVGTRRGYEIAVKEASEYATVLDFWPIAEDGWNALFGDDFDGDDITDRATELLDQVERDLSAIKEGKTHDGDQPNPAGVPGDGN